MSFMGRQNGFMGLGGSRINEATRQAILSSLSRLRFRPSDISTLYQDSAATTPVTAIGDPVGKMLDISGNGNHATQATAGARPTYARQPKGGRRNILNATDTLATQNVTSAAIEYTLSFKGTGTVTLSGTSTAGPLVGTGANDRVSLTFTPTAGTLTLTVSGSVTEAQLERGAAVSAYQSVVAAYDVTEAGVPSVYGLLGDGVDDFMSTAAIDFSDTDAVTVLAALTKMRDTADAVVLELTVNAGANNGAFNLRAPYQASNSFGFLTHGVSAPVVASNTGFTSPYTAVLAGLGDISADSAILRVNGSVSNTNNGDQGAGNYSNAALYLFMRAGTTLPFKGFLSDLAIAPEVLSASELALAERLFANDIGVTL